MTQILELDNGMTIEIGITYDDFIKATQTIKVKHEENKVHTVILSNVDRDVYQFLFRYKDLTTSIKVTNVLGTVVLEERINSSKTINVSGLKNGKPNFTPKIIRY